MNAPVRLALYSALLVAIFAVSYMVAGAVVPEETVANWVEDVEHAEEGHGHDDGQ